MTASDLKNLLSRDNPEVLSETLSLYQRNLLSESSNWLKKVETRAKQLKTGKVILVAILKPD